MNNDYVKKAEKFARMAHDGILDKVGEPFILHPESVVKAVEDTYYYLDMDRYNINIHEYLITAWLHDVIEDTNYNIMDIKENVLNGMPQESINRIMESLLIVTNNNDMTYDEFIDKIINSNNVLALIVKYSDMDVNMNRSKEGLTKEKIEQLRQKYTRNFYKLQEATDRLMEN